MMNTNFFLSEVYNVPWALANYVASLMTQKVLSSPSNLIFELLQGYPYNLTWILPYRYPDYNELLAGLLL
jgi:hypothetical protein